MARSGAESRRPMRSGPKGGASTSGSRVSEGLRGELSISERVRVPKTAELVAQVIRSQIVRGELTEGDALPPESQLTGRFGTSRPTLREARRILESESLTTPTPGSPPRALGHAPAPD